jgi:hypothetical protein
VDIAWMRGLTRASAAQVKRLCMNLRRYAKEERVLIHYNGHGVPRPTDCGEIWVFNKVRAIRCSELGRSLFPLVAVL